MIPSLSLDHQQEIVDFLDEQFKLYDINKLSEAIKNVPIFNLLIKKEYNEFADLLHMIYRRIEAELRDKTFEIDKRFAFKALLNGVKCEDKKLGDIVEINIGGTPLTKNNEYWENGTHLWCSVAELNGNVIEDTIKKITDIAINNSSVKLIIPGSILMSFKLSIGKFGIAKKNMYCNEAIMFFKHINHMTNNYLMMYLKNTNFSKGLLNGSIGCGSLNLTTLKLIPIKLPSLEDQQKIISEIELIEKEQQTYKEYGEKIQLYLNIMYEKIQNMNIDEQPNEPNNKQPNNLADELIDEPLEVKEEKITKKVIVKKIKKNKPNVDLTEDI
jgi:restriction endonuclease S subunit